MKPFVALFVAIIATAASACGTIKSTYTPEHAAAGELLWKFDGSLKATRSGSDFGLTDLSDAVACVPEARSKARSASVDNVVMWSLLGTGIAAVAGGGAVAIWGASDNADGSKIAAGLGGMGGGLILSLLAIPFASALLPDAVDAVNIYNDQRTENSACLATK